MQIRRTIASIAIAPLILVLTPSIADSAGRSSSVVVNTIRNGKGVPKSSLGIDGDFYIDTRSLLLYGPKKNGKWPAPQNLQGPVGPSGSDGKNGSDGRTITPTNTQGGAQGPAGPQGIAGEKGAKGEPGLDGAPGSPGPAGAPGSAGAQGPQGPQGATGATGPTGATGAQGPAGSAEVTVIDIPSWILSSALPVSYANSQNFGTFEASKSYLVNISISSISANGNMVLGLDMLSSSGTVGFTYIRSYARYATYSSNQWIYKFEVTATYQVGASDSTLSVRIIDGLGDSGASPLTFTGKAYITLVGAIR